MKQWNMTDSSLPHAEFAFPGPLRDALVASILAGRKTTTTSLLVEYDVEGEELPVVGRRQAVVDSKSYLHDPGFTVTDETVVVLERFRLINPELSPIY
ncbi:hypothetical protein [Arthrobacter pityocampae]|nr:hypothetical protein [Arthrobacter pityocampae]